MTDKEEIIMPYNFSEQLPYARRQRTGFEPHLEGLVELLEREKGTLYEGEMTEVGE